MKGFKKLLVRTYSRAFLEYDEWSLTFKSYNDSKNNRKTIVKTEVHQPDNIHYRMLFNNRSVWKVDDFIIEGVSLVTNYRSSFNQEIAKTGSLEGVIKTLVEKNNEVDSKLLL